MSAIGDVIADVKNNKYDSAVDKLYDMDGEIIAQFTNYPIKEPSAKTFLTTYSKDGTQQAIGQDMSQNNNFCHAVRLLILDMIEHYQHMKLKEEDEIKNPPTKITYVISIGDDPVKIKLFCLYLLVYAMEADIRYAHYTELMDKKVHVGIDYEFNNRQIALMQINFETLSDPNNETFSYIWLVNPGEFDTHQTELLHKYLMTNTQIYKIFHGPDSLDIPYMYNVMFEGNHEKIINFTKRIIDTRFLCEYQRISVGLDRKCSIYDALLYFDTITKEKYNALEEVHENMGPVQDISWSIHKMSSYHVLYALYDVLFLKHYLLSIYRKIDQETPQFLDTYKYIISLTRFVFLERNEITDVTETLKPIINSMNNFMIKHRGRNITMVNIFNEVMKNLKIPSKNVDAEFFLLVGYFKKAIAALFKYVVYALVAKNFDVYENKFKRMEMSIEMDLLYDKLNEYGFSTIANLMVLFGNEVEQKIKTLYR